MIRPLQTLVQVVLIWLLAPALVSADTASAQLHAADFELGDVTSWSDATSDGASVEVSAFRITEFELMDPHVFVDVPVFGCSDITNEGISTFGITSINDGTAAAINGDENADGCLDFSSMLLFRALDQVNNGELLDSRAGRCSVPAATTACSVNSTRPKGRTTYSNSATVCLDVLDSTASDYSPSIVKPAGPCFVSEPSNVELELLEGLLVPLIDFQSSASFGGVPASLLSDGLSRGFLRETDADALALPSGIPILAGQPLSVLFPGGTGNCSSGSDLDMHLGESGWWIYVNFVAEEVPWIGL